MTEPGPALALRELRKTYVSRGRPAVDAVRGIDIELRSGELLGLLGPSGCGKSTTLRMIAGLEKVTGGDILVGGDSVVSLPARERNIGVAFENYALYPPLTVAENLGFGLAARGLHGRAERARRVGDMAERIGITDLLAARPAGLSSGQKQRVALARALIREPDVLLLDEPLSHLDAAQRDTTRRELKRIQRDLGHTTILVTHDQEEALSLADRIAVMRDGVIQQLGTPYEIYDAPANMFVADFVGEPAINLLPGVVEAGGWVRLGGVLSIRPDQGAPAAAAADVTVGAVDRKAEEGDNASPARSARHPRGPSVRFPCPAGPPVGREVVLGIRPEDLRLTREGEPGAGTGDTGPGGAADGAVRATVSAHEPLLESGIATLTLDGVAESLVVETGPEVRLDRGDTVRVTADPQHTHVFDAETGDALT